MFSRINIVSWLVNGGINDLNQNMVLKCRAEFGIDRGPALVDFDLSLCNVFVACLSNQVQNGSYVGYDAFLIVEDDGFKKHNSADQFVDRLTQLVKQYAKTSNMSISLILSQKRALTLYVKSLDIDVVKKKVVNSGIERSITIIGPFYSNNSLGFEGDN